MPITMHLQTLSRLTIKPASPTPPQLKTHTLSLFDQLSPNIYVPFVFFFHPDAYGVHRSELLIQSLSNTLSRYYPFAGRIKDKVSVDCNDEGVTFVEARLGVVTLSEMLESPRSDIVEMLFVDGLQWKDCKSGPLLAIQVTYFECGGLAIGVLLSHKLGDMATLVKFVTDWGLMCRDSSSGEEIVNPVFDSADLFPHGDLPAMSGAVIEGGNFTCKRFVFEASKIQALKNTISEKVKNPTRVEVVTALIYKAIISASRCSNSNSNPNNHPTVMLQTLNLRTRVVPPLPESTVGSLVSFFPVAATGEREVEVHELVGIMKKEMAEFCNKYAKKYRTKEWLELIKKRLNESREILSKPRKNQLVYRCSSGCNFPIYGVDFGWGAAAWVTMAAFDLKNTVMMLDDKNGGGIEALVSLDDKEMAAFQHNEELLAFASLNPSANYANY